MKKLEVRRKDKDILQLYDNGVLYEWHVDSLQGNLITLFLRYYGLKEITYRWQSFEVPDEEATTLMRLCLAIPYELYTDHLDDRTKKELIEAIVTSETPKEFLEKVKEIVKKLIALFVLQKI